MKIARLNGVNIHYHDGGDRSAPAIVFANSLGTDFRLWDKALEFLPARFRVVRFDNRGHGLSSCGEPPWSISDMADDAISLMEELSVGRCVFVGLSIGGLIAQDIAFRRPDLLRGAVFSNTGARIGNPSMWDERISSVREAGVGSISESILERWFSREFREGSPLELDGWRNMLCRTCVEGYVGCSMAIAKADYSATTPKIAVPSLAIAGSEDGSTPPDLLREISEMVSGCRLVTIEGAGHLPCVERPEEYARVLLDFADSLATG